MKKNEKGQVKNKPEELTLTVPRGTEITADKLIVRKKNPYWESYSWILAFLFLTVFPLFMLNVSKVLYQDAEGLIRETYKLTFTGSPWYYNITRVKAVTFRVLTIAYAVVCILALITYLYDKSAQANRLEFNRRTHYYRLTLPQILLIAYIVWSVVAAIFSKDYSLRTLWTGSAKNVFESEQDYMFNGSIRTEGLYHLFLYSLIFLGLSFWGEYSEKHFSGMSVMALIFGALAVPQIFGSTFLYPKPEGEVVNFASSQFLSTIGNVDCVGGLGAIVVPALFCAFVFLRGRKRWLCLSGFAIMNLVALFSDVDSYRVGLVAALAITFPFLFDTKEHATDSLWAFAALGASSFLPLMAFDRKTCHLQISKISILVLIVSAVFALAAFLLSRFGQGLKLPSAKKMRLILAIVLLVCVLGGLLFLFFYNGSNRLLNEGREVLHGHLSDEAGSGRGYAWKASLTMIKENPITGTGPGTYYYEYNPRFTTTVRFDLPHNDFLQIGVHTGLVGLALYLAFLIALAVRTVKAANRSTLVIPFACAAAGYLVHSFFSFSIAIVTPLFWVVAGLLEKCIRQMPTEVDVPETEK